jgi:hypothetical protein
MEATSVDVNNQSIFTQKPYIQRPTMDSFKSNAFARASVYPSSANLKI